MKRPSNIKKISPAQEKNREARTKMRHAENPLEATKKYPNKAANNIGLEARCNHETLKIIETISPVAVSQNNKCQILLMSPWFINELQIKESKK